MESSDTFGIVSAPGDPMPLGVSRCGKKYNFAVSVPNAGECILHIDYMNKNNKGQQEETTAVFVMTRENRYGSVFSLSISGLTQNKFLYWYEAFGKTFADPYARQISGRSVFGKTEGDSAAKAVVEKENFLWNGDRKLKYSYNDLILYKLHVRGFTKHSSSGVKNPGTFAGIVEKIRYLKDLGVNGVLLMPCYDFNEIADNKSAQGVPILTDSMRAKGVFRHAPHAIQAEGYRKVNYWGYGAKSFYFAPKASYASKPEQVCREFKTMVRELHKNGIEVLMELDFASGTAYGMILDAIRFWVSEYHIDGFRISADAAKGELTGRDPYLSDTKLISSGWDIERIYGSQISPEYRNLAECNEGFMTDARRFIKGDEAQIGPFTTRFIKNMARCGTINYITDHNGFTLYDLYSYDRKHNEQNGERNQDGTDFNFSWNCGAEGDTALRRVQMLRLQMFKNAVTALFLSQGTPMLLAGDEFGNSQNGNNNAYCQDNEIGWLEWKKTKAARTSRAFVAMLIRMRKEHVVFHNPLELKQMDYISSGCPDISFHGVKAWYPDHANYCRTLGILLNGAYAKISRAENDVSYYLVFNMHWEVHAFDLPFCSPDKKWKIVFATSQEPPEFAQDNLRLMLPPRSAVVCVAGDK